MTAIAAMARGLVAVRFIEPFSGPGRRADRAPSRPGGQPWRSAADQAGLVGGVDGRAQFEPAAVMDPPAPSAWLAPAASARTATASGRTGSRRRRPGTAAPGQAGDTVKDHPSRIYEKIGVHSRAEAIALWLGVRER